MKYKIVLTAEAREDLRRLAAHLRAKVVDGIEEYLSSRPDVVSKSRIKKLRGYNSPAYRLRIDDIRVFYDVFYRMNANEGLVEVLAI